MSVPLTGVIDSDSYSVTCLKLIQEFLSSFFVDDFDADIETVERDLNPPLQKPLLHFVISGGQPQAVDTIKFSSGLPVLGETKSLNWALRLITDDNCGGLLALANYSGHLDAVIRSQGYYLAQKGLRKNQISVPIPAHSDHFYQHLFTLTNQVVLSWEVS